MILVDARNAIMDMEFGSFSKVIQALEPLFAPTAEFFKFLQGKSEDVQCFAQIFKCINKADELKKSQT